ncbi:unnamed protein product [Linum tenue]|uniref:endo-polygalacturonase n=2 Tax=Linum tenue TaxID=586396 RepID=A0AAV0J413_9ROSI|nr:unnamed protein product [Linum tenue]
MLPNPLGFWVPAAFCLILASSSFPLVSCFGLYPQNSQLYASSRRPVRVKIVNVDRFGAKGDGRWDDTQAFEKAWKAACSSTGPTTVFAVPKKKIYLLKPITFAGPCRGTRVVQIFGTIKASRDMKDYENDRRHWIKFESLQNFRVKGGGTIDGNGQIWWQNSCKVNTRLPCKDAPNAVTFYECNNIIVSNLKFRNSQKMHVSFDKCADVKVVRLFVAAPENSPNTDGIHVTATQNIQISRCVIKTGDDCISIVSGSRNVKATDITCGPGHGISIGSLGAGNSGAQVSDVVVNRAILTGTSNGVRIKTWQGGSGYARNIQFQNIAMNNVTNPIIIDQNYCDRDEPCHEQASAVRVSNVMYKNIKGTSASKVAINLECSKSVRCHEIVMQDVSLASQRPEYVEASCVSVDLTRRGIVTPLCSPN